LESKGKERKERILSYSAILVCYRPTHNACRHGSHSFTCKLHHTYLSFVSVHQMVPLPNDAADISCSLLLTYRPRKDERLRRPGWLTYSGRFTHMSGHALTANRAQDREVRPPKTDVLPLCILANTHCWNGALNHEVNTTFHCHITWNASQTALKRVKTPLHKANKSSAVAEMGHRGHNRHGPKTGGGSVPFWGGRAGSPSNTMSLGSRSTCIPSGILIHPGFWQQQTWAENWKGYAPFGGRSWVPI